MSFKSASMVNMTSNASYTIMYNSSCKYEIHAGFIYPKWTVRTILLNTS